MSVGYRNIRIKPWLVNMSSERQPLLENTSRIVEQENYVKQSSSPRPDVRLSPETVHLSVQTDDSSGPYRKDSSSSIVTESDIDNGKYDPAQHRTLDHPTSNVDTLIHLLKGNIGTGILALPNAFKYSGLYVGLFGTLIMGVICTHCMHMLVNCAHILCQRMRVPALGFAEVSYSAFLTGPTGLRKYASLAKDIINMFLCITQLGFCCVYFVFVAVNIQEVVAHFFVMLDIRIYLVAMLIPTILLNLLGNLKYLTPVSLFASVLTVLGLAITLHYMFQDLPRSDSVDAFASWSELPLFFGTAIYAFEGIGVILPLENNMKNPEAFGGLNGVLNTGMVIVACLYTAIGFFGYLKYGDKVQGSVTLNLPPNDILAQSVRVMMALAIFLSYTLQFYVPINIVGPYVRRKFSTDRSRYYADIVLRISLVVFTFFLAAIIPNLGPIISLVGAVSSSTLALIFPPVLELIVYWNEDLGKYNWRLWKDVGIIVFGLLGFFFGTYTSIAQIINPEPDA